MPAPDPRIALVSRELYPLSPEGIGRYVSAAASVLAEVAEVTVVTSASQEGAYRGLVAEGDPRLPSPQVRIEFVPEPGEEEAAGWTCKMHCYSARVYERLRQLYPAGGPELVEFPDLMGEAFVTIQAAHTLDPFLAGTRVCVRLHGTAEMRQVLNAHRPADVRSRALHALERFSLKHAERLLWPGGDVLCTYRRFYGADALASGVRIRTPHTGPVAEPGIDAGYEPGSRVELLYRGTLERRQGLPGLVRAASSLGRDDFRLTLVGPDTGTGPLGVSMRRLLELEAAGDERIVIHSAGEDGSPTGGHQAEATIEASDLVVLPSLWDCWPQTALTALHLNRPLLVTPVGGLIELAGGAEETLHPGRGASGWLAGGTDWVSLQVALGQVIDDREWLTEVRRRAAPVELGGRLADPRKIVDGYLELARPPGRRRTAAAGRPPLVSAVVPYFRASRFVTDTIRSLREQTYARLELVLVVDGGFEDRDWVVAELAERLPLVVVSKMNAGLGAARNFGVMQSRGRYFFPLDADNLAEPEFVERCVAVLESRPEVAYSTAWSHYIDERGMPRTSGDIGYEALGNQAGDLLAADNFAGDAAAVVRRRLFDSGFRYSEELTSFEDWHFYRELAAAGHFGAVIPERLLRYRVHESQMQYQIAGPRRGWLEDEIEAHVREHAVRWTAEHTA